MMAYRQHKRWRTRLGLLVCRGGWMMVLLLVVGGWSTVQGQEGNSQSFPLTVGEVTAARPEVGQLFIDGHFRCTATLITARHFLTAAHCVDYAPFFRGGRLRLDTRSGLLEIPVERIFSQGHRGPGAADLAVGRLVTPVAPRDAVPASIAPEQPIHGDRLTAMGYGCTDRDTQAGGGSKRFREYIYRGPTEHLCYGDSGGPVFLGRITDPGPLQIVRVHSGFRDVNGHDIGADAVRFRTHILALTWAMEYGDICYRVHAEDQSWMPATCDGAMAGTTGQSRRVEALQIWSPRAESSVCYQAHVQDRGWMEEVCDGAMAGTTGKSRRLEALVIRLDRNPLGGKLRYRAHVEDRGWMDVVGEGVRAGTTGQERRLEALQIWLVP